MTWLSPKTENYKAIYGGLRLGMEGDFEVRASQVCACDCACDCVCPGGVCDCTSLEHGSHRLVPLGTLWED